MSLQKATAWATITAVVITAASVLYGAGSKQARADVAVGGQQAIWGKLNEHDQAIAKLQQARQDDHELIQETDKNVLEILRRLPK